MKCVTISAAMHSPNPVAANEEEQHPSIHIKEDHVNTTPTHSLLKETINDLNWLQVFFFVILFYNMICVEHAVLLVVDGSIPATIASFNRTDPLSVGDPSVIIQLNVYTRGLTCWEAENINSNRTQPHPLSPSAGCLYAARAPPQHLPMVSDALFIRFPTAIFSLWFAYQMLPKLEQIHKEFGSAMISRVAVFSATCALVSLVGNAKVLDNAFQQASRLTVPNHQNNANRPATSSRTELVLLTWKLSVMPIIFSGVVFFLSLFAAILANRSPRQIDAQHHHDNATNNSFLRRGSKSVALVLLSCVMCSLLLLPPLLCLLYQ